MTILFIVLHSATFIFFHRNLLLIQRLLSKNGKITIVYNDMMLMSKHHSNIKSRCKTTVLAFTFPGSVVLLLMELTSALDDKSIGVKYCQKISE